jgi:hypothetical protein
MAVKVSRFGDSRREVERELRAASLLRGLEGVLLPVLVREQGVPPTSTGKKVARLYPRFDATARDMFLGEGEGAVVADRAMWVARVWGRAARALADMHARDVYHLGVCPAAVRVRLDARGGLPLVSVVSDLQWSRHIPNERKRATALHQLWRLGDPSAATAGLAEMRRQRRLLAAANSQMPRVDLRYETPEALVALAYAEARFTGASRHGYGARCVCVLQRATHRGAADDAWALAVSVGECLGWRLWPKATKSPRAALETLAQVVGTPAAWAALPPWCPLSPSGADPLCALKQVQGHHEWAQLLPPGTPESAREVFRLGMCLDPRARNVRTLHTLPFFQEFGAWDVRNSPFYFEKVALRRRATFAVADLKKVRHAETLD